LDQLLQKSKAQEEAAAPQQLAAVNSQNNNDNVSFSSLGDEESYFDIDAALGPSEWLIQLHLEWTPFGTKDIRRESILEYRNLVNTGNNPISVMFVHDILPALGV
jgi:hypothetical protein